jgi:hypothetical protein
MRLGRPWFWSMTARWTGVVPVRDSIMEEEIGTRARGMISPAVGSNWNVLPRPALISASRDRTTLHTAAKHHVFLLLFRLTKWETIIVSWKVGARAFLLLFRGHFFYVCCVRHVQGVLLQRGQNSCMPLCTPLGPTSWSSSLDAPMVVAGAVC